VFCCPIDVDPDRGFPFYWGYAGETGSGRGEGMNRDFPPAPGAGEGEYPAALDSTLRPPPIGAHVGAFLDGLANA
jgi:acetoin utilization deacetylase AcuC-like enzyme